MPKLIIDARMINHSGIGIYLQNLIPILKDHFLITLLGNPLDLNKFSWSKNVKIVQDLLPIYSIKEQLGLPVKIKKTDIFWSPHYNIPVFPVRSKSRVTTIHDLNHLVFAKYLSLNQKLYARFMMKRAVKISDRIITVSKYSRNEIVKYTGVSEEKIRVIYNGVNGDYFKPTTEKNIRLKVKKKYNLPGKYILYVGNVKPHKNLKSLLKAYEKIIQNNIKDYHLVIVGKKMGYITEDKEIFDMLDQNSIFKGKVIFTDFVENEDLPVIYTLASLFVFPSLYEGFGFPPLESMACGCPVIAANVTSLPEVCGDAAYYVNPLDVDEMAKKMINVLFNENLRKKLIEKGFKRAKLFKWEESTRLHIELFEEVLKN